MMRAPEQLWLARRRKIGRSRQTAQPPIGRGPRGNDVRLLGFVRKASSASPSSVSRAVLGYMTSTEEPGAVPEESGTAPDFSPSIYREGASSALFNVIVNQCLIPCMMVTVLPAPFWKYVALFELPYCPTVAVLLPPVCVPFTVLLLPTW